MGDSELHARVFGFLAGEFAKKDNQVCVKVELEYRPGRGLKDEQVREWIRADDPELFEMAKLPEFCSMILDVAEYEADAKPPGKHAFVIRTHQYFRGRQLISFSLQPSSGGGHEEETGMTIPGAGRGGDGNAHALQVISQHANQMMRTNMGMFDVSVRVINQTNERLSKQNAELHAENIMLRREVEEARSTKLEREYAISKEVNKEARAAAGWNKAMQIAGIVAAKITGGGGGGGSEMPGLPGQPSPLQILLGDFKKSIRPEQFQALFSVLDQMQLLMLNEIMSYAPDPPPQQQPQPEPSQDAAQ